MPDLVDFVIRTLGARGSSKAAGKRKRQIGSRTMGDCQCRPLGFLIGLPFAFVSMLLSIVGIIVWIIGSVLTCLCPCCICCTGMANLAVTLVQLPISILQWFIDLVPC